MKTITPHYIDGKFVEPHGREVMDSINPADNTVIGSVTLADEEDARRAIAAAKRAFASFGGTSKEERGAVLRRLHEVVTARIHDLTAEMVEEYGGVYHFSKGSSRFSVIRPTICCWRVGKPEAPFLRTKGDTAKGPIRRQWHQKVRRSAQEIEG